VFHCQNIPRCCFLPISKLLRLSLHFSISPTLLLSFGGERTPAIPENWLMALWPFWNFFGSGLAALGSWPLQAPPFTGWIFRPECGSCAELIAVAFPHQLICSLGLQFFSYFAIPFDWCITRNNRTITKDFHFSVYICIVVAFVLSWCASSLRELPSTVIFSTDKNNLFLIYGFYYKLFSKTNYF